MRILSTLSVLILCIFLTACTKGNEINGRSLKTANRSVNMIKNRLPTEKRIEFEVSYWTLRDDKKNKSDFLAAVNGKTPEELIELGKEIFQRRKAAGFKSYTQYANWDQMITQFAQERIEQNKRHKTDPRDKKNNVNYKL